MKKITKILLPIASTIAIAAPIACMTSCSGAHFSIKKTNYGTDKIESGSFLKVRFQLKGVEAGSSVFGDVKLDEHIKSSDDSIKSNIEKVELETSHTNGSDFIYLYVSYYFVKEYQPKIGDRISIYVTVSQVAIGDEVLWTDSSWLDAVCK